MTVAQRMALTTAVALLGAVLLAGIGNWQMGKVFDGANYGNANTVPSIVLLDDLRKNYLRTRIALNRHLLVSDSAQKKEAESLVNEHRHSIRAITRKYETHGCRGTTCISDAHDRDLLNEFSARWEKFEALIDPILAQSNSGQSGLPSAHAMMADSFATAEAVAAAINEQFDYNVKLSETVAEEAVATKEHALLLELLIAALTVLAIAVSGYSLNRNLKRQLGGEPAEATAIVDRIASGDLRSVIQLAADDHSSVLAKISVLKEAMERLAKRVEQVGKGDLGTEVALLSEHDRLGKAINEMIHMLRTNKAEDERRNWIKDGYGQLSQGMTGDLSLQQLADAAISIAGRHLGAGRGVFYAWRTDEAALDLLGSYMYTEGATPGSRVTVGEGAIGQVAREMKPIILTSIDRDAAPIVTGTTRAQPLYTYTYPLLHENTLLGVIEVASFERFDETRQEFLVGASNLIASFLCMAEQRQNIRKLLADSERAEAEARATSERLQIINTQMEEQQQQLQAQSEELQQSNALLEEQQQQLQAQSEEMQQSNAQLEEQQQLLQQQSEELQQHNAQMEEQQLKLEAQNRELQESQALLDAKAKEVAQASQYKSEFLANMSHELRTPLNSIILLSKMMQGEEPGRDPEEQRQWAQIIHRSGEDLLRLINDVLDLSKIEAGRMDLHLAEVASEDLRSEFIESFEHQAKDQGVAFSVEDDLQCELLTDADKVRQILRNLLSNAFKFTRQGSVTLRFSRRPGTSLPICLSVRDTGIGIPEEKQALVFEAFQQADGSTSREYGGTGLGLTISQRFAQLLGGTIELSSVANVGSEFCLLLPDNMRAVDKTRAAPPEVPAPSVPPAAPVPAIEDERHSLVAGDRIILLIDDDPVLGRTLMTMNRRLGYKTLVAHTGTEGLSLVHQYHPQGILLDLGLPDMDGAQVLHEVKSRRELANIPVYIVSARDRDLALLQQGAVGILQKPVDEKQLADAEESLLKVLNQAHGRAILVVENGGINAAEVARIVGPGSGPVVASAPGASAREALRTNPYRLAIIDLGETPVQEALDTAAALKAESPDLALVFYAQYLPSEEDEARLRRYSDGTIVKAAQAEQRLLESIERFLNEVPRESTKTQPSALREGSSQRLAGKRVLVVDDDPRNLFVFSAALEKNGAKVSNAVNGKRALELLAQESIDLVLLDIMMPQMDGYQTISQIRENPALAGIPVLAITAKASPAERDKALAAGFDDYMTKPVSYEMLVAIAEKWCSGKSR